MIRSESKSDLFRLNNYNIPLFCKHHDELMRETGMNVNNWVDLRLWKTDSEFNSNSFCPSVKGNKLEVFNKGRFRRFFKLTQQPAIDLNIDI